MQVTEHIHAIRIPFRIPLPEGKVLERYVFAYLIYGREICLVDSGVSGASSIISEYVINAGRRPEEITMLVFTHSHPDHIGGAFQIREQTGCIIAAHPEARRWIEDTELQFMERPVPGFHNLVEGPVQVDQSLKDSDIIDLGGDTNLKALHTPGHSGDSISLIYAEDNAVFSGDLVPVAGEMPVYEDAAASVSSIKRLREIGGIGVLLSSWKEPLFRGQAYAHMDEGIGFIKKFHKIILRAKEGTSHPGVKEVAQAVIVELGLPPFALNPIFMKTIEAHLNLPDASAIL